MNSQIIKIYKSASQDQINYGKMAYVNYHNSLAILADEHKMEFSLVVAAFATLSPSVNIDHNFEVCKNLVVFVKNGGTKPQLKQVKYKGYHTMLQKAYDYLTSWSDFEGSLGKKTQKIRHFYHNILEPENCEYVTIDRHAIAIYMGREVTEQERAKIFNSPKQYRLIADAYKNTAKKLNILPCELQAIVWYVWRDRNKQEYPF